MKKIVTLVATAIAMQCVAYDSTKIAAFSKGADVNTFIKVIDDDGNAVSNAFVKVCFGNGLSQSKATYSKGFTNVDGIFEIKGRCKYNMGIGITKEDYYAGYVAVDFESMKDAPAVVNGTWKTPKKGYECVLLSVRNPTRLIVCNRGAIRRIPAYDQWIAYDFSEWDFCKPFGNGVSEDVLLRFWKKEYSKYSADFEMELSFTNHPCAGFYTLKKNRESELQYAYSATTNTASYRPYCKFEYKCDEKSGLPVQVSKLTEDEYMVFRTRTVLDSNKNIISANYGLIGGGLGFGHELVIGAGYFNPNVNDPNLEDLDNWKRIQRQRKKE